MWGPALTSVSRQAADVLDGLYLSLALLMRRVGPPAQQARFVPSCDALEPDEEDVFCPRCGGRWPKGTAYCGACGAKL